MLPDMVDPDLLNPKFIPEFVPDEDDDDFEDEDEYSCYR